MAETKHILLATFVNYGTNKTFLRWYITHVFMDDIKPHFFNIYTIFLLDYQCWRSRAITQLDLWHIVFSTSEV